MGYLLRAYFSYIRTDFSAEGTKISMPAQCNFESTDSCSETYEIILFLFTISRY